MENNNYETEVLIKSAPLKSDEAGKADNSRIRQNSGSPYNEEYSPNYTSIPPPKPGFGKRLYRIFFKDPFPATSAPKGWNAPKATSAPKAVAYPQQKASPFCSKCGKKNQQLAKFCPGCGNKLV